MSDKTKHIMHLLTRLKIRFVMQGNFIVTLKNLAGLFCSLAPPTVVGGNTAIKKDLPVSPAHEQPYTWICCHVEEATKTPSKACVK